jgi:putative endonuclease
MMGRRQQIGRWGEDAAAAFLVKNGYDIVARNVRTPYGEIDLIARQGGELVFVEVKARTSLAFGLPETGITPQKKRHMLDAITSYMQDHPEDEGAWRVNVIAVRGQPDAPEETEIVCFEDALQ